jgi:hypothetical protein
MHHQLPQERPPSEGLLIRTGPEQRRGSLILDSMVGWYRALIEAGDQLPAVGGRSWRVDVVVRPAGWLGTFRRSRTTGLWFSGRHRFHLVGNETASSSRPSRTG